MEDRGDRYHRAMTHPAILTPEEEEESWAGISLPEPNPLFGEKGVRDPDNPCDYFDPMPNATYIGLGMTAPGNGDCDSDGHYLCLDCTHLSKRRARELVELRVDKRGKKIRETPSRYLRPDVL